MSNDWRNWEFKNINKIKNKSFGKKFKLIFFFFIITICLISNLKLIEVLSLADGKIIPQGRIKFVQHLEGGIVEEILIKVSDSLIPKFDKVIGNNNSAEANIAGITPAVFILSGK